MDFTVSFSDPCIATLCSCLTTLPPLPLLPTSYCSPFPQTALLLPSWHIHEHTHTHVLYRKKMWCFSFLPPLLSCLLLTPSFRAFHCRLVPFLFSHHACMQVCTYKSRFYIWERCSACLLSLSHLACIMASHAVHFLLMTNFILLYG